ncbi:MAG: sigma factor-like helix-turn-helix DNA-binding protein [Planctomycetota bacterium]
MMNPSEYLVFVLYYVEHKSIREIADVMNLPESNIRAIHDRVVFLANRNRQTSRPVNAPAATVADDTAATAWHAAA